MKVKRIVTLSMLAIGSLGLTLSINAVSSRGEDLSYIQVEAVETVEEYYSSISDSLEGQELLEALNTLNKTKKKKDVTYAGMRQFAAKSDIDPDGSGKIVGFYDNKLVGPQWDSGSTWNREHVWPNVRGGNSVEADAHMVRPAAVSTNGDRGSKGYGIESYDPGQFVEYYRGSASRIIFYAAIADTKLKMVDDPLNYHGGTPANSMGSISEMLAWNLEYLPSDTSFTGADDLARRTELNRNEVIQKDASGQGNRNPFIDHPEYACRIWGNMNDNTRKACNISSGDFHDVESMTINVEEAELYVGDTLELSVTVLPEDAHNVPDITWSSSDNAVASVSKSGMVLAVSVGEATVSFKSEDNKFSGSCHIEVKEVEVDPNALKGISLDVTNKELEVGENFQLNVILDPVEPTGGTPDFLWSSSDQTIANVNGTGKVFAYKEGEVDIKVVTSDHLFEVTCHVVVKEKQIDPNALKGISLDVSNKELEVGENFQLNVILDPVNPTGGTPGLIWTSSNMEIANVNGTGKVFAYKVGEVNITVETSDRQFSATCKVVVKEKEAQETPSNPSSSGGCGGSVITTSAILSTISLLGVSLLLTNKFKKRK